MTHIGVLSGPSNSCEAQDARSRDCLIGWVSGTSVLDLVIEIGIWLRFCSKPSGVVL